MNVLQIFRKKNRSFFSIEKVFEILAPSLASSVHVHKINVPEFTNGLVKVYNNLRFLRRLPRYDVYHITGDIHYVALAFPGAKTIVTIHDCVFLHNTTGIKRRVLKWLLLDMPVKRCAR